MQTLKEQKRGVSVANLKRPQKIEANKKSRVDHVIAVMSGKGGVGKSMVTALSALASEQSGWRSAILDADITGPSIPRAFGLGKGLEYQDKEPHARQTNSGIQVVSTNLILEHEEDPILWKGPMVAQAIHQFWTDVVFQNVDFLFVDMPPGTGDVPLTVFQSLPIDGVIIVTTPQDLVSMIVAKAVNMAQMMGIPIVGMVENMAYFEAPDTGKRYEVFGPSRAKALCQEKKIPLLAQLPIQPDLARLMDEGKIEEADTRPFRDLVRRIEEMTGKKR